MKKCNNEKMDFDFGIPPSTCLQCTTLLHINNDGITASPTQPIRIWAADGISSFPSEGFRISVENSGNCSIQLFARRSFESNFPHGPEIMINGITARPFQPFLIVDPLTCSTICRDDAIVEIAVLCVKDTKSHLCPVCCACITIEFPCGSKEIFRIEPNHCISPRSTSTININGTVTCKNPRDTLNVKIIQAKLISCPFCKGAEPINFPLVPIIINPNNSSQGTFTFTNVRVKCFRIEIICVGVTNGTVLGSLPCQPVIITSEMTPTINVGTIQIDCNNCLPALSTVTGTVTCGNGSSPTTVVGQLVPCPININNCMDSSCGIPPATEAPAAYTSSIMASTSSASSGSFTFFNVTSGCYVERFVCATGGFINQSSSCSFICGTGANSITTLSPFTITNCAVCNTGASTSSLKKSFDGSVSVGIDYKDIDRISGEDRISGDRKRGDRSSMGNRNNRINKYKEEDEEEYKEEYKEEKHTIELSGFFEGKCSKLNNLYVVIIPCNPSRLPFPPVPVKMGSWSKQVLIGDYEIEFKCGSNVIELVECNSYTIDYSFTLNLDCSKC